MIHTMKDHVVHMIKAVALIIIMTLVIIFGILLVQGSADLVRLLAQYHLIDEYALHVAPLILGKGKRLFQEGDQARLQLANTKAYKTGMLTLNYEPVKQQ